MILDLHVHSRYSFDSLATPERIIRAARKKGLGGVAITDHDTIRGAVEAKLKNRHKDFMVIIGAEIATDHGDIIGLFLEEEIGARDSLGVIEEIHRQGGIAVLPHPYKGHDLEGELIERIDVIECFNSRTGKDDNEKASALAMEYDKPTIAGSDAHFLSEIGAGAVICRSTDVMGCIISGDAGLVTGQTPSYYEGASQLVKSLKQGSYGRIPGQLVSFLRLVRDNRSRSA